MSGPFTSPTPWLHRNTGGTETVVDRTGQLVCILGRGFEAGNAALIVASPGLKDAARLTLMFHAGGPWDGERAAEWTRLTGHKDATTKILCDFIRKAIAKSEQDGGAPEDGPVETGTGV